MKTTHLLARCLISILALSSTGCATVLSGTKQKLIVNSNPPGATFEVDGQSGVTPGTVDVSRRKKEHTISFHKPGYQSAQVRIGRKFGNPWIVGNSLIGGGLAAVSTAAWPIAGATLPIGVGVDFATGAAFHFPEDNIRVNLQPLATENQPAPPTAKRNSDDSAPDLL